LVTAQDKELPPDMSTLVTTSLLSMLFDIELEQLDEEDRRRDSRTCYIRHKEYTSVPSE